MPLVGRNYYKILWLLSTMISNICCIVLVTIFLIILQEWCLHPILTDNIIQTHIVHSCWNLHIHVRSLLIFFYRYRFSSKTIDNLFSYDIRFKHSSFLIFYIKLVFRTLINHTRKYSSTKLLQTYATLTNQKLTTVVHIISLVNFENLVIFTTNRKEITHCSREDVRRATWSRKER